MVNEPTTLGEWKAAALIFGWEKAAAYLDEKIEEQGEDTSTIAHSSQILFLLASLEQERDTEGDR